MIMINPTTAKKGQESLEADEADMLAACVSKIKKHINRNLEQTEDHFKMSRLLSAIWYLNEHY